MEIPREYGFAQARRDLAVGKRRVKNALLFCSVWFGGGLAALGLDSFGAVVLGSLWRGVVLVAIVVGLICCVVLCGMLVNLRVAEAQIDQAEERAVRAESARGRIP